MKSFNYTLQAIDDPVNLPHIDRVDTLWMLLCSVFNDTPMWRGWNSQFAVDSLPKQTVHYMENIQLPPTRLDVVKDTLIRTQQVAKECHQKEIIVTYDLAIAKPALQIQSTEAPRFDNIFICFGAFHIQMTYFACLGHFLEASGGPQILSDNNILAQGSLNGFLSGRHFNRCKRVHSLLATAIQIMHFRQFLQQHGPLPESLMNKLNVSAHDPSPRLVKDVERSASFGTMLEEYEEFCKQTRSGHHGATAEFWMAYVDLMRIYRLFDRACRTNDVALYIYALGRMCSIFFAANRPNYSRWMVVYHLRLLNMAPSIRQLLGRGALSIRRTSKNFARSPVDLTLEQTVNKDAASRHTGMVAFQNNDTARKRWMVTRPVRAAIVGHLLDTAGISHHEEDGSKELQPYRIKRDNKDLETIMQGFETTMNPFSAEAKSDKLFCVATGRAASQEVADDILNFEEKGGDWCEEFRQECKEDQARFRRPIKRRKVKSFTNDAVKIKMPTKDKKVKEVSCTRDLFGRLLCIATTKKVDLQHVLTYPLLEVPLSLCHIDGTKNKTDKAVLMRKIESEHRSSTERRPDKGNIYLIDAMFFFRTLPFQLPSSFAGVARVVLAEACKFAHTVHLICDRYDVHPTIKDLERASRGDYEGAFNISGGGQTRPSDFSQSLKSASFKMSFIKFLSNEWKNDEYVDILGNRTIYLALDEVCYKYQVVGRKMSRILVQELTCNHLEADTRILLHARYIADNSQLPPSITVPASDSDIFILLLYHARRLKLTGIWMDVGLSSDNSRRSINISAISQKLGSDICDALPGFHAFTGCDYTASFMRKGKGRPYQHMVEEKTYISVFQSLGNTPEVSDEDIKTLESFVCRMYGKRKETQVNTARYLIFRKIFSPHDMTKPLESLKSSEPSCLPPCKKVLLEKIKRSNYVTMMWKNAIAATPIDMEPQDHGWTLSDDKQTLSMFWFLGSSCPIQLHAEDIEEEEDNADEVEMDVVFSDEEEQEDDEDV